MPGSDYLLEHAACLGGLLSGCASTVLAVGVFALLLLRALQAVQVSLKPLAGSHAASELSQQSRLDVVLGASGQTLLVMYMVRQS